MGGKSSKSKGPVVDDTPKEIVIELPTTEEWTIETHDADGNKFIKMKTRDDMITLDRNATVQAKFEDVDTDLKEQKKRRGSSMKRRKQITTGEANNAELKESIRQADAETLEIVKLNAEEKKRLSAEFDKNKISNSTSALKSIIVDRDTIEAAKQVDQNDVLATSSSLTEKNKAARQSIREKLARAKQVAPALQQAGFEKAKAHAQRTLSEENFNATPMEKTTVSSPPVGIGKGSMSATQDKLKAKEEANEHERKEREAKIGTDGKYDKQKKKKIKGMTEKELRAADTRREQEVQFEAAAAIRLEEQKRRRTEKAQAAEEQQRELANTNATQEKLAKENEAIAEETRVNAEKEAKQDRIREAQQVQEARLEAARKSQASQAVNHPHGNLRAAKQGAN